MCSLLHHQRLKRLGLLRLTVLVSRNHTNELLDNGLKASQLSADCRVCVASGRGREGYSCSALRGRRRGRKRGCCGRQQGRQEGVGLVSRGPVLLSGGCIRLVVHTSYQRQQAVQPEGYSLDKLRTLLTCDSDSSQPSLWVLTMVK